MGSDELDGIVKNYFRRLEGMLARLPDAEREPLLAEIRSHVKEARAEFSSENEETIRELLDRVGRPEDIASEAIGEPVERRGRLSRRALIGSAAVLGLLLIATVLGLVLSGSSGSVPHVSSAPTVSVGGFPTAWRSMPRPTRSMLRLVSRASS